jgi:hypothetical protein
MATTAVILDLVSVDYLMTCPIFWWLIQLLGVTRKFPFDDQHRCLFNMAGG